MKLGEAGCSVAISCPPGYYCSGLIGEPCQKAKPPGSYCLAFQDNCLFPHKSVIQNIILGLERTNRRKFMYSPKDLLGFFKLNNIKDKFPHEISSGEAQRVSLARSLISSPDLLLLDEPFANIDQILK